MKRLFWVIMGVTIGALVARKVNQKVEALSPTGIGESLGNLAEAVRDFADDVREAMADRERELTDGVGLDGKLGAKPEDF